MDFHPVIETPVYLTILAVVVQEIVFTVHVRLVGVVEPLVGDIQLDLANLHVDCDLLLEPATNCLLSLIEVFDKKASTVVGEHHDSVPLRDHVLRDCPHEILAIPPVLGVSVPSWLRIQDRYSLVCLDKDSESS